MIRTKLVHVYLPIRVPLMLYQPLRYVYRKLYLGSKVPNLMGDREIEYSFAARHIPKAGDKALDFGAAGSYIPLVLARAFNEVVAMDRLKTQFLWSHPKIKEVQADILDDNLSYAEYFDVITNISSVEHVGLAGRYGTTTHTPDGDLIAMKKLRGWLKPDGIHILTIPVGKDSVCMPFHRIYGSKRLPLLLDGYKVVHEEYWAKPSKDNKWHPVEKEYALNYEANPGNKRTGCDVYALGCFVLHK